MKMLDQQAYDLIFKVSQSLGFNTYETMPENALSKLPLVLVGSAQMLSVATKSYILGECHCTVDVWGSAKSRKLVSDMAHKLLNEISKEKVTAEGHNVKMNLNTVSVEVQIDQSTDTDLWRAILMFELTLS